MTDRDDCIRELAYLLWLEEGCPEGQAERHWQTVETIFDTERLERKCIEGEPPGDPANDLSAASGPPGSGATLQILRRRAASRKDR
jgi:Protein of unknown function (DUF2934)